MAIRFTLRSVWTYFTVAVGVALMVLAVAFREYLLPPPPGYSVAVLGALAVVMALVMSKEPSKSEKAGWIAAAFALMALEMWAVSHDRAIQDKNFNGIADGLKTTTEQGNAAIVQGNVAITGLRTTIEEGRLHFDRTMEGITGSINTQTGGDSFAFISFTAQQASSFEMHLNDFVAPKGLPYFVVSITSHGKYPLRGIHAVLIDDERRMAAMQEYNQHPNGDFIHVINSADIEYQIPYLRPQSPEAPAGEVDMIGLYLMPQANSKRLSIIFAAPNGYWNEALHLGRVNGIWHQCLSVVGPTIKQNNHPFIYCDTKDWPEGEAMAQKDWQVPKPQAPPAGR